MGFRTSTFATLFSVPTQGSQDTRWPEAFQLELCCVPFVGLSPFEGDCPLASVSINHALWEPLNCRSEGFSSHFLLPFFSCFFLISFWNYAVLSWYLERHSSNLHLYWLHMSMVTLLQGSWHVHCLLLQSSCPTSCALSIPAASLPACFERLEVSRWSSATLVHTGTASLSLSLYCNVQLTCFHISYW